MNCSMGFMKFPCTFIAVVEVGHPKNHFLLNVKDKKTELVHSHGKFISIHGKNCDSRVITTNKELKPYHVQSKVIQYCLCHFK